MDRKGSVFLSGGADNLPKYLFIIDEINRAELSKVFGEIMYCLEPDYRGPKGKIKTQYSNMNTEKTFFVDKDDDWFFIPSNVYIIGTMNDIDRSVEVFDFALRRRFAWREIDVDKNNLISVLNSMLKGSDWESNIDEIVKRAEMLNDVIADNRWNLSKSYKIGPAYFGKIKLYKSDKEQEAYLSLWNNHLKQLLFEYVRGMGDEHESEFVKKCREAFMIIKEDNES